jgi:hypothetical protein
VAALSVWFTRQSNKESQAREAPRAWGYNEPGEVINWSAPLEAEHATASRSKVGRDYGYAAEPLPRRAPPM